MEHEASFTVRRSDFAVAVRRYWCVYNLRKGEIIVSVVFLLFVSSLALWRKEPGVLGLNVIILMLWGGRTINYVRTRRAALKRFPAKEVICKVSVGAEGLSLSCPSEGRASSLYRQMRIFKYGDMWLLEEAKGKYVCIILKGMPVDVLNSIDKLSRVRGRPK
jgi:hypothetical protein